MMKVLVFIWGHANLFPILTPVILFPIFWFIAHLLRENLERYHSGLVFLITCAAVGAMTYENFVDGPDRYAEFLAAKGVETEAYVTGVTANESSLNGTENNVSISFSDQDGEKVEFTYGPHARRFYPPVEQPVIPPGVGDRIRIRYFPGVPLTFIVLSDPKTSVYGAKIACDQAKRVLAAAEKAYNFEQFASAERRINYRNAIEKISSMDCIDFKERERLQEILPKL